MSASLDDFEGEFEDAFASADVAAALRAAARDVIREFAAHGIDGLVGEGGPVTLEQRLDALCGVVQQLCATVTGMGSEIRSRRLVIEDREGTERIYSICDDERTTLAVSMSGPGGAEYDSNPTVFVEVEIEGDRPVEARPAVCARIECTTGDDAFAILEQRTIVDQTPRGAEVLDSGGVRLHQQRSVACHADGELNTVDFSIVEVGPNGVVETDHNGRVLAHAPMQWVPRTR